MLRLPEDLELEFREELIAFEEETQMPYVTSVERIGIQKGRREGRREGEAAVLLSQMALKFGPPSEEVRARIEATDADTLLDWSARILTAEHVRGQLVDTHSPPLAPITAQVDRSTREASGRAVRGLARGPRVAGALRSYSLTRGLMSIH